MAELALASAEHITAAAAASAAAAAAADPAAASAAVSPPQAGTHGSHPLALAVCCAALAGLRPSVLAPRSTRALADALLQLILLSAQHTHPHIAHSGSGDGSGAVGGVDPSFASVAAVALAAAVNRWQDDGELAAWLDGEFRPRVLAVLAPAGVAAAPPPVVLVQAVGWVGRALAMRNHPSLEDVLTALKTCLVAAAVAAGQQDGGGGGGAAAMDVDRPTEAAWIVAAADADAPAAAAAAQLFGVLVADGAGCCGVSLYGRPQRATCRVLWQQRTFQRCVQVGLDRLGSLFGRVLARIQCIKDASVAPGATRGGKIGGGFLTALR